LEHLFVPSGQAIVPESKNCLQGVAKNTARQDIGQGGNQCVLGLDAVLIFVDKEATVPAFEHAVDAALLYQFGCCPIYEFPLVAARLPN